MSTLLDKTPEIEVISSRFQELLDKEGATQESFAKKVGLSRGHISKVLTSKALPSGAMCIKLANAGYDVTYLLSGKESSLANWATEKEKLLHHIEVLEGLITKLK